MRQSSEEIEFNLWNDWADYGESYAKGLVRPDTMRIHILHTDANLAWAFNLGYDAVKAQVESKV